MTGLQPNSSLLRSCSPSSLKVPPRIFLHANLHVSICLSEAQTEAPMVSSVISLVFLFPPPPPPPPLPSSYTGLFPSVNRLSWFQPQGLCTFFPRKPLHLLLCFLALKSQLNGRLLREAFPDHLVWSISCSYFKALMTLTLCLFVLQLFLFCHPLFWSKLPEGRDQARLVRCPVSGADGCPGAQRCWQEGAGWRAQTTAGGALTLRQTWKFMGPDRAQVNCKERNAGG